MRSLSSCRAFNHKASYQNGSKTSIFGLKVKLLLKDIIFITQTVWLVDWNSSAGVSERQRSHLMLLQLFIRYAICSQGYLLRRERNGMSHEADADYVCDSSWQIGKVRKMKVLTLSWQLCHFVLSFAISVSDVKRRKKKPWKIKTREWKSKTRLSKNGRSVYWRFTSLAHPPPRFNDRNFTFTNTLCFLFDLPP